MDGVMPPGDCFLDRKETQMTPSEIKKFSDAAYAAKHLANYLKEAARLANAPGFDRALYELAIKATYFLEQINEFMASHPRTKNLIAIKPVEGC